MYARDVWLCHLPGSEIASSEENSFRSDAQPSFLVVLGPWILTCIAVLS